LICTDSITIRPAVSSRELEIEEIVEDIGQFMGVTDRVVAKSILVVQIMAIAEIRN
jgi:hypothetical protein